MANSVLDSGARGEALKAKYASIDEIRKRVVSRKRCFRNDIVQYFGESPLSEEQSLALRIVNWLFSTSERTKSSTKCCDVCDGVQRGSLVAWASQVFAEAQAQA
jgi:hypothetical protein